MRFFSVICICLCALMSNSLTGQETKFGKVSKAELEEKFNPLDSATAATYLFKKRRTYFEYQSGDGFNLVTSIHNRIKIYNQDGFEYATKEVALYKNGSSKEKVTNLKAATFNLKDGKIEQSKLKKDGEFMVELSESWDQKSFTMPNISEGSVIEYKYELRSPFISNIDEFIFQHAIPVKHLEATMEAPEYFKFRVNMRGFLAVSPERKRENKTLRIQQRVPERTTNTGLRSGGAKTSLQTSTINYQSDVTKYTMNNVPALKEEPYVNGMHNYRSGVSYELSYTDFPNTPREMYSTNWEAVVKSIYESSSFGSELKKSGYYEDAVDAATSGMSDPKEKIAAIYSLVKSKVKWNEFYGKYTRDGVRKAYKEGKGNIAEINLMLTSMLRYAGLEANPVLVSTRSNGIPLFPTREGYNYVISCVQLAEGSVLLDATDAYSIPNVLPFRTLNWEGRIIKKDGTSENVSLYPNTSSTKRVLVNADLSATGMLEGKVRMSYTNHDAVSFRKAYYKSTEDDYLENLENELGEIEISNFEVQNADVLGKAPRVSYEYLLEDGSDVVADKLYFAPMSFFRTTKNPFTLENREFPIDFGYPTIQNVVSTINLPEGYTVESMPESMSLALPEGLGSFKFIISNSNNQLQLNITTKINNAVVAPIYYQSLKEYYKKMIEKMNEKVVLSKA